MKRLRSAELPRLPKRALDAHKGSAGRVLVVGGSWGMAGAAWLAAAGAVKSGAGYVRVACPESIYPMLAVLAPWAVFVPLRCGDDGGVLPGEYARALDAAESSGAAVFGPGMGESAGAGELFAGVLGGISIPSVIDASALFHLSGRGELLGSLPAGAVLTPHPGEMARLLGVSTKEVQSDREAAVAGLAERTGATAVLKGARTLVSDGERFYENTSGNAGMATAGSGDVLSGVVASFIAQGLGSFEAACLGVYLHGKAGDIAAAAKGRGLAADDIAEGLAGAVRAWEGGAFERGGGRGQTG